MDRWSRTLLIAPLVMLTAACGSTATSTHGSTPELTSASKPTDSRNHDQAVRLAKKDYKLRIALTGQHRAALKGRPAPATTVACVPSVDIRKVVSAPGTILSVYRYLKKRIKAPLSPTSGFVRNAGKHNRIVLATLGFSPPIPHEAHRPLWNGFGYSISADGHRRVQVEIDAFVVPAKATCTTNG